MKDGNYTNKLATDDKQWADGSWFIEGEGASWSVLREIENGSELISADLSYAQSLAIKDAHNAALAAERQKAWPNICRDRDELKQQLLQAQATIAELHKLVWSTDYPSIYAFRAVMGKNPDLSALERHDAEVRKPLVDALQKALLPIAAWKLTDKANPYKEIGPDLRQGFTDAHEAIIHVLSK